jgi:hypothetical protein
MGAQISSQTITQTTNVTNSTLNKTIKENIQKIINESGQESVNINSVDISDITCGGSITIGQINQSIKQSQNIQQALQNITFDDFKVMTISAADAAQKAVLQQAMEQQINPVQGQQNQQIDMTLTTNIKNEVTNETNLKNLYEEFTNMIQAAANINKTTINNIICGGDFKFEGAAQNIEAIQIAGKISDTITKQAIDFGTKISARSATDIKTKQESKGLSAWLKQLIIPFTVSGISSLIICVLIIVIPIVGLLLWPKMLGSAAKDVTEGLGTGLKDVTQGLGQGLKDTGEGISTAAIGLGKGLKDTGEGITPAMGKIVEFAGTDMGQALGKAALKAL